MELYNIAAGKAILAHLPTSYVAEIIDETEMQEDTENTITDVAELNRELEQIRDRGYALNRGEVIRGFRAVGCLVITDGILHGALAIGAPESRLCGDRLNEEVPNILMSAANELEMQLRSRT